MLLWDQESGHMSPSSGRHEYYNMGLFLWICVDTSLNSKKSLKKTQNISQITFYQKSVNLSCLSCRVTHCKITGSYLLLSFFAVQTGKWQKNIDLKVQPFWFYILWNCQVVKLYFNSCCWLFCYRKQETEKRRGKQVSKQVRGPTLYWWRVSRFCQVLFRCSAWNWVNHRSRWHLTWIFYHESDCVNHNESVRVGHLFSPTSESSGIPTSTHTHAHAKILYMPFNCNDLAGWWLKLVIDTGLMCRSRQ